MHKCSRLLIQKFGHDPLAKLPDTQQRKYLQSYLHDLNAATVLVEPQYFDRDYLAEFTAFYGISARGYPNICQRLHFFSLQFDRKTLALAAGGSEKLARKLQANYLGFAVLRPIPVAPFGRTVLRWYSDDAPHAPRVTNPKRLYRAHVAGLTFSVEGLAWQQQDTGVGACATVGLWTMLHSIAFDDHHAIPTTADITRAAHRTASLGTRVFPSTGLTAFQLQEAIKEHDLAPVVIEGNASEVIDGTRHRVFTRERFASTCAALIRSGYPVLICGVFDGTGDRHAICAVGFREAPISNPTAPALILQDQHTDFLYLHDDNLGPNVRFQISERDPGGTVFLKSSPPPERVKDRPYNPTAPYPPIVPYMLLVAVHEDLRTSPDALHQAAYRRAFRIWQIVNLILETHGKAPIGLVFSTRFLRLPDYLGEELARALDGKGKVLSRVRLALCESVCPMSRHLGVVRVSLPSGSPAIDVLFDTTDSDRNHPVFATVHYLPSFVQWTQMIGGDPDCGFGKPIKAW